MLTAREILLVFLVALVGLLAAGCSGSQAKADADVPPCPEEAINMARRVSGREGVYYRGNRATLAGVVTLVNHTVVAESTDYEVQVQEGVSEGMIASF